MCNCIHCGRELTFNDVGATKKFINRASRDFMCIDCLAAKLNVPSERILIKIEGFKRQGCTLFI